MGGGDLTCEQLAMVLVGRPMEGAQPTSLTQSLWASSFWSSFHWPSSSLGGRKSEAVRMSRPPSSFTRVDGGGSYFQSFTKLSQPPETKRLT